MNIIQFLPNLQKVKTSFSNDNTLKNIYRNVSHFNFAIMLREFPKFNMKVVSSFLVKTLNRPNVIQGIFKTLVHSYVTY